MWVLMLIYSVPKPESFLFLWKQSLHHVAAYLLPPRLTWTTRLAARKLKPCVHTWLRRTRSSEPASAKNSFPNTANVKSLQLVLGAGQGCSKLNATSPSVVTGLPFQDTASVNLWSYELEDGLPPSVRDARMRTSVLHDHLEREMTKAFKNKACVLSCFCQDVLTCLDKKCPAEFLFSAFLSWVK